MMHHVFLTFSCVLKKFYRQIARLSMHGMDYGVGCSLYTCTKITRVNEDTFVVMNHRRRGVIA